MDGSIDFFHLQIGTLDHSDLDGCSACFGALGTKRLDFLHRIQSFGQIGLQHDAPGVVHQARVTQNLVEHFQRHVEIFELFHVQIEEGGWGGGGRLLVERHQALDHARHRFVIRPHRKLARNRRHFDRDVIHIFASNQPGDTLETPISLLISEHCFAEEIDIELVALTREVTQ